MSSGLMQGRKEIEVLHVGKYYPPHPGGMESHLQALCAGLKDKVRLEVVVANDVWKTSVEEIDGVKVTRLAKYFDFKATPMCPALLRKIRESDADIVHIHWPNPAAIFAYLMSGHRGRMVFTYHSDVVRQKFLSRAVSPWIQAALRRADYIIVSSPNYISASNVLSAHKERCRVIPFGIPVEHFQQRDESAINDIRNRYGPRIVLGVGRLVYYKGFEHLIRAMKRVDARLLIVGEGPLRSRLESEAQSLGIADRVTLLSNVKDVRPFFHAADLFALPSVARSEAFGIVQLEAMACGKPVVNTWLESGVPFVSPDGVSGLTVPPADAASLGRAINLLLGDPDRCAALGEAGRKRARHEFSLSRMVSQTFGLYRELIAP